MKVTQVCLCRFCAINCLLTVSIASFTPAVTNNNQFAKYVNTLGVYAFGVLLWEMITCRVPMSYAPTSIGVRLKPSLETQIITLVPILDTGCQHGNPAKLPARACQYNETVLA
jgi:hypothetical protein